MMRERLLGSILSLLLSGGIFSACSKHSDSNISGNIYIASPEGLMDMAGQNWDALKPGLQNEKGYWYTEFPESQDLSFKAAISLPAIEQTNHAIGYSILLNVDRQTGKVMHPVMAVDTVTHLSLTAAANLMLEYYNRSLARIGGDTTLTYAWYTTLTGIDGSGVIKTTVADIVAKLSATVAEYQYALVIHGTSKGFNISITKYMNNDNYGVEYESYAF